MSKKKQTNNPFYRIHKIDTKFNRVFSKPLFVFSAIITFIASILPYYGRVSLAYFINFFFNRPTVYIHYFAEKIGKKMNAVTMFIFYMTVFGFYAIVWKIVRTIRKKRKFVWKKLDKNENHESYFYQS